MGQQIVERQDDGAGPDDAEIGGHIESAVVAQDGDTVARLDALFADEGMHSGCKPVHVAEGIFFSFEFDEGGAGSEGGALLKDLIEGEHFLNHGRSIAYSEGRSKAKNCTCRIGELQRRISTRCHPERTSYIIAGRRMIYPDFTGC